MTRHDIRFLRVLSLQGPNVWTYRPALEALIDIGDLEEWPSNRLPGFTERLLEWMPSLIEHRCGLGYRGGFVERLRDGTWAGHIMEHLAIELHNLAGIPCGFGKARSTPRTGVYRVVIRTPHESVGRLALYSAADMLLAAAHGEAFDLAQRIRQLEDTRDDMTLGPSTAHIVEAARQRGIPAIRLTGGNLVQLGYGAQQRRIWTAETDLTSAIAESIASDKDLTKSLLQSCGIPVPEGERAESPAHAWELAQDMGVPVVVKPSDANHGRGVSLNLVQQTDIESAWTLADKHGSEVLVERFVPGEEHRLLVVGQRLVAAARGESAWITGDGQHTIATLIDQQINTDPRRGTTETHPLNRLDLGEDEALVLELQRQGLQADSIVPNGRRVLVQHNGNVAHDCTADVHPDVAAMAVLAARVVGLDIAGIDLVTPDIGRPLHEQGGAIVEVNAGPGLLMHIQPAQGQPQPVGQAIVEHLFGPVSKGRIPVVGVVGGPESEAVARHTAQLLTHAGHITGLACASGMYVQMRRVNNSPAGEWVAGRRILMNRSATSAVVESTPRHILEHGLPYDRCQVGVVTGIPVPQGLEDHFVTDPEGLLQVLRTQVDVVLPEGCAVIRGDEPFRDTLAQLCDGAVIYYGREEDCTAWPEWLQTRVRCLLLQQGRVVLHTHDQGPLDILDRGQTDKMDHHVLCQQWLPAIAAVLALDLSPELIRAGVEMAL